MAKQKEKKTNAMRILESAKVSYEKFEYEVETFVDGIECTKKIGKPLAQSFKTLVTVGKSKQYYVLVIPVAAEVDFKKAAKAAGEKSLEMIHVKELTALTGYVRGGVSPVGMKKQFPTIVDATGENFPEIYVSGGKIGCTLGISPQDLQTVTRCTFADLCAE